MSAMVLVDCVLIVQMGVLPVMAIAAMSISVVEFLYDGLRATEPFKECNVAP
ncbi:hypothetical protein B0G71_6851 [Paraburkholderia sp. BL27I4N3]|nr:hypothetical protein B0G71_6851 [Paraburkholderia sp. BL27I4N3]RKR37658.1 hypothetical protein B0G82_5753 [Paraburkholderia sp. BL17N1]